MEREREKEGRGGWYGGRRESKREQEKAQ
jgi:hypothetical protein